MGSLQQVEHPQEMKRGTGVEACWMNLYDAGVFRGPPKIYFWGVIGYLGLFNTLFLQKNLDEMSFDRFLVHLIDNLSNCQSVWISSFWGKCWKLK